MMQIRLKAQRIFVCSYSPSITEVSSLLCSKLPSYSASRWTPFLFVYVFTAAWAC